jgi:hypothetical protein
MDSHPKVGIEFAPKIICISNLKGIPRMTELRLPGPDKNMLAVASSALRNTQISTKMECYCTLSPLLFIFYGYHCMCKTFLGR